MSGQQWYYAKGGKQMGPVSAEQIAAMAASGQISGADYVWTQGMQNWAPFSQMQQHFPAPQPQAPGAAQQPGMHAQQSGSGVQQPHMDAGPGGYQQGGGAQRQGGGVGGFDQGAGGYGAGGGLGGAGGGVDLDMGPSMAQKYAYPAGGLGGGGAAFSGDYAGFWLRFVAAIIDGIVLTIIGAASGCLIGAALGGAGVDPESIGAISNVLGIIINLAYFSLMESGSNQATLGKKAMGLRVTDINGDPVSLPRALGRNAAKYISALILMIGFIMAAFTPKKQALHDMIAGCLVVKG